MASYVLLLKEKETEGEVVYKFGPDEQHLGKIKYDKKTRMLSELIPVLDSIHKPKFYFDRAARRIARCILEENGEFPKKAYYTL